MARKTKPPAPPVEDLPPPPEAPPPPPVRSIYDLAGSPERGANALRELADKQGRVYGRNTMLPLSEAPIARILRLPFGIFWLDLRTRGGLVIQRFNRLWGPPSTLKSTLCLRAIRSAQNTCRHCKYPLVLDPDRGRLDCRCPSPRWWLLNEEDYSWLPMGTGLALARGELPPGAEVTKPIDGRSMAKVRCEPPPGAKGKAKDIILAEMHRCEPFRTLLLDSERSADIKWVQANGVDPRPVVTIGAKWGEQSLDTTIASLTEFTAIEGALTTKAREVDFLVIDSTSMLEAQANLEKGLGENPRTAARALLLGRWTRAFLSAAADEGLTSRYAPTVLSTSQVTTHGIGYGQHAHLAPTDGYTFAHALALDIQMSEDGYTYSDDKTHARYGDFNFKVRKNKAGGSPGVTGTIKFWVQAEEGHAVGDSDDLAIVMGAARKLGEVNGKDWIAPGTGKSALKLHTRYVKDGMVGFGKVGDLERFLDANPTIYNDLRARVLDYLLENGEEILGKATPRGASAADEAMDV